MPASNPSIDFKTSYQEGKLSDFFALTPEDCQSALEIDRKVQRAALYDALHRYAQQLGAPEEVFVQLERLKHPESRVVVTGQQAGLLLGPSYTLSKAITALKLAQELSTDAKPVLAVFWVASQDHDTDEIDASYLLDFKEVLHYLKVDLPQATPAARIPFDSKWLETLFQEIESADFKAPFKAEVRALMQASADVSQSFSDWFSAILYRLLGKHGLIILDPMQPDIAELFKPLFMRELEDPTVSVTAVNTAAQQLKSRGFEPQLGRGEAATNLFVEELVGDGFERVLLRFDGEMFFTERCRYAKEALLAKLELDPRSLTPAAGLRPISQDFILPTAITVVGPGELKYFAQLKGVYSYHEVAMPLIWDRATATLLEPPVARIMQKFGLSLTDLGQFKEIKREKLLELHGHAQAFNETLESLNHTLEKLLTEVHAIDPTLAGTVNKGEKHFRQTYDILKAKTGRALANRDDTFTAQFDRLEKHLLPNSIAQERLISPFSFFLKFGIEPVMRALLTLAAKGDHAIIL